MPRFELRQIRSFVAVAKHGSFSRAGEELHIAQQAVSQQIKALERSLGVMLLLRSSRRVELTPEGRVFLTECNRVLSATDRAVRRVRAAAAGEAGTVRLAYTLTTAFDTIPTLLARLGEAFPELKVDAREVFGGDIADLLLAERYDVALAPIASYPAGFRQQTVRREPLCVAVGEGDPLAAGDEVELPALRSRRFEMWPRAMAPGFFDAVVGACRAAGFEPELDEHAAGNTVWGYIARGQGIGLINWSVARQLPRGIKLLTIAASEPMLTIEAVYRDDVPPPAVGRLLALAAELAAGSDWN
jgi:DNA-binding transcriptional LysR family regulator